MEVQYALVVATAPMTPSCGVNILKGSVDNLIRHLLGGKRGI
jgi:hypothetical protein